MKKIVTIIVAVAMLVSCFAAFSVSAADYVVINQADFAATIMGNEAGSVIELGKFQGDENGPVWPIINLGQTINAATYPYGVVVVTPSNDGFCGVYQCAGGDKIGEDALILANQKNYVPFTITQDLTEPTIPFWTANQITVNAIAFFQTEADRTAYINGTLVEETAAPATATTAPSENGVSQAENNTTATAYTVSRDQLFGAVSNEFGTPGQYSDNVDLGTISDSETQISFFGWFCTDGASVKFGYAIDGGYITYDDNFSMDAEQGVLDAAPQKTTISRFQVDCPAAAGAHTCKVYAQIDGANILIWQANYLNNGASATVAPTLAPAGEDTDNSATGDTFAIVSLVAIAACAVVVLKKKVF